MKKEYEAPVFEAVDTLDTVDTISASSIITPEHPFSWGR